MTASGGRLLHRGCVCCFETVTAMRSVWCKGGIQETSKKIKRSRKHLNTVLPQPDHKGHIEGLQIQVQNPAAIPAGTAPTAMT